jgi:hypothetical protein
MYMTHKLQSLPSNSHSVFITKAKILMLFWGKKIVINADVINYL